MTIFFFFFIKRSFGARDNNSTYPYITYHRTRTFLLPATCTVLVDLPYTDAKHTKDYSNLWRQTIPRCARTCTYNSCAPYIFTCIPRLESHGSDHRRPFDHFTGTPYRLWFIRLVGFLVG